MSLAQKEIFTEILHHDLATKSDIAQLTHEIEILKIDMVTRTDIAEMATKTDITHLKHKIELIIMEFKEKFNLLYWMIGFVLTFNAAILYKLFL